MICIVGNRRTGKTEALIKLSSATGIPIFTHSNQMAHAVKDQARRMGVAIPQPETFCERSVMGRRRIMIDEAQEILERHGVDVVCATFDASHVDMSSITLLELIGMWWRTRRGRRCGDERSM